LLVASIYNAQRSSSDAKFLTPADIVPSLEQDAIDEPAHEVTEDARGQLLDEWWLAQKTIHKIKKLNGDRK
jgi:hypothetical protein